MTGHAIAIAGVDGNRIDLVFHDHDDEGCVSTSIAVRAGHFSGSFHAAFHTADLVALHEVFVALQQRFDVSVEFAPAESWLRMAIVGDRLGHLRAQCEVRDALDGGARISFALAFDQSYLPELLKQSAYVLDRYAPRRDGK